jgi:hypothetical protein
MFETFMWLDLREGVGPRRVHSCKPFPVHDRALNGDKWHHCLAIVNAGEQSESIHAPQYGEHTLLVVSILKQNKQLQSYSTTIASIKIQK